MPLENTAPINTHNPATRKITFLGATLDPIAEFKKLTASLLTHTIKSKKANKNKIPIKMR